MSSEELFERILATPAMFIGARSPLRLLMFMEGYRYAKQSAGEDLLGDLYRGFQKWIEARYNIKTAHDWARIITFMSADEVEAFEKTKELWNEYKSSCGLDDAKSKIEGE